MARQIHKLAALNFLTATIAGGCFVFVLLHLSCPLYFSNMALELKEVIQTIESGDWISMVFITANVKKGTGGKVITIPKCRIARNPAATSAASSRPSTFHQQRRNVDHNFNFTRNVELPNKHIITVHPPLVTQINNQSVI